MNAGADAVDVAEQPLQLGRPPAVPLDEFGTEVAGLPPLGAPSPSPPEEAAEAPRPKPQKLFPKSQPLSPDTSGDEVAELPRPSPDHKSAPTVGEVDKFLAVFGDQLRNLPEGRVVLLAPKTMQVNDKREVEARVGYEVPIDVLKKGASSGEEAGEGRLRVSVEMAAVLTGPGFAIEPVTPAQQSVAKGFPTVWKWNVAAKESGSQELEATLFAILPDSAGVRLRIDSYVQTITVNVREETWNETFGAFGGAVESVGNGLDQLKGILVTLFGAGITVFGWLKLRRRKQRAPSPRARYRSKPAAQQLRQG
ncbi:hypothetical protein [Neomesorhizobium albiziae]|nr:hypothetical protein [Mesorhizobium albiziae]GLS28736.1 hypothetical protein GCM10007937_04430 [Mesorhizobium albiziae]